MFFVHKHEVALCYGGAEEGGWWYTSGVPVEDWDVIEFSDEEAAYEKCRSLNGEEHVRAEQQEDYDFHSVLASRSTHYSYTVEDFATPEPFPSTRPHYE